MTPLLIAVAAYLTGAIPFGFLLARYVKGVDIRQAGSGNIGATNVGRVLGVRWGLFVLLLDILKGILPTALYPLLLDSNGATLHLRVLCGLAAIVGHMFPCWLKFRGGKGVATALGVIIVLFPWATVTALLTFAAVFAISRIVSVCSVLASVAFLIAAMWQAWPSPFAADEWSRSAFSIAVPLLIILRHRTNLVRLLHGEEPRFQSDRRELDEHDRSADSAEQEQ